MQLWGFAYKNNSSSLHDDYCAPEWQGIYLLVIMSCVHEYQGEGNYHCILQPALITVPQVLFYVIILLEATKWKRWTMGSSFALSFHECPSNVHEKQVCEQGVEYISMKENKTMAKIFVTWASRRVNYLYKIINETVLVYSSACEAGSWMHTINIVNALRVFGNVCGVCTLRWKLFIAIVSKSGQARTRSKLEGSA